MRPFSPFEKAACVLSLVGVVAFYILFALRRMRPYGPTLRARVEALLAYREPAIVLDSARVIALVAWMRNTPDLDMAPEYLRRGVAWTDPVGVFQWVSVFVVPPNAVVAMVWIFRLLLALAALGVAGRAACAVAALLHGVLWSVGYSTVGYSVHNHVVFMMLLTLALSPEPFVPLWRYGRALREKEPLTGVGTYFSYVRVAAAFAIATVYVQTGIEKVLHGSPRWFNGLTLQGHSLRKDQLSCELAKLPLWSLSLLAVGVVAWEAGFGLVFFHRKLRPLGVASGWAFHLFVREIMGVRPFAFMMSSVLFVYTPYEAWSFVTSRLKKKKPEDLSPKPPPEGEAKRSAPSLRTPSVILLAVLLAAQWVPTFTRRGTYPFLGNAMFSSSLEGGEVLPAEARALVRLSDGTERQIPAPDAIAVHWITFTNIVFAHYRSPYKDQIEQYAGTQQPFCKDVLREIVRYAEPRAARLQLLHDYFVAGQLDLKTEVVQTCTLDAAPQAAPEPTLGRSPSNGGNP